MGTLHPPLKLGRGMFALNFISPRLATLSFLDDEESEYELLTKPM